MRTLRRRSTKRQVAAVLAGCGLALPSVAPAIEGLPGSTWGSLHEELPQPGDADAILEGWIRQGIAWKRWEWGAMGFLLSTYLTLRYKWDSQGFDWNNYLGPGAGISVGMTEAPLVSWGVEFIYQWNDRSRTPQPYTALYTNWYHWWYIREKSYPGSTWGDLRWEVPNTGTSNLILQGWIRQGIVLKRWEAGSQAFLLVPYLRIRYNVDSRGLSWNNYVGPGAGLALDMESAKGPLLSWGAEYGWEKNLWSGDAVHRVDIFMRWYASWDLAKK